jgi:hypothetical protein
MSGHRDIFCLATPVPVRDAFRQRDASRKGWPSPFRRENTPLPTACRGRKVTESLFVFISEAKRTKNEYERLLRRQMLF